jgi:hypothetical protein
LKLGNEKIKKLQMKARRYLVEEKGKYQLFCFTMGQDLSCEGFDLLLDTS